MTSEPRTCQNCKQNFTIEPDDFGFYEKIRVPPPTFCPKCRLIRRLAWRNERSLYNRKCQNCGKKIVTIYSPETQITIYCETCWWGDGWDGTEYGVDIDFSKPFLVQLFELRKKVPALNLFSFIMINSPYCNMANDMKNCYLVHDGTFNEDVSYGSGVFHSKDSQDISLVRKAELSYELTACINCYHCAFSEQCQDSVDVYFSHGLRGCSNCFGCIDLRGKNYYIFNEPYTKKEYEEKIRFFGLDSHKNILSWKQKAEQFFLQYPRKYYFGMQNTNFTGDFIENGKNIRDCFFVGNIEDSKFCSFISNGPVRTTYDFTHYGDNIELMYECLQCGDGTSNVKGSWGVWTISRNVNYTITSPGVSDIFGCIGLKKKQYCILNKQYTKEQYEELLPRLIQHMNDLPYVDHKGRIYKYGDFFPAELSLFGYNETTAQEYFPLTEKEARDMGFNWRKRLERDYEITKSPKDLPDSVQDVDESILNEIIACEHEARCNESCMTAFRILPEDREFYERHELPHPTLCPNCRHFERIAKRNPLKLWDRQCAKCSNEIPTSYSPDRPEVVYCIQCYQHLF